jgi:membrane-bound lytic murein transglycosylase F
VPTGVDYTGRWWWPVWQWLSGLTVTAVFLSACYVFVASYEVPQPPPTVLERILQKGKLTIITRNNAHCYYLYRGEPMGFEYDLARAFADFLGVRLSIRVAHHWEGMIPELMAGNGDLIAASMTITPSRREAVAFSKGYLAIRQHVIAQRGEWTINSTEDLAGRTIDVRRKTSYQEQLEAIAEGGVPLIIRLHEDVPTEELIRMVADGDIDLTVADTHIAQLNRRYYPKAVPVLEISERQELGWAVRMDAVDLLARLNTFFDTIKANGKFSEIYNRHFSNLEWYDYVDLNTFHRRLRTRLPKYQAIIKEVSAEHGFDWRLISAQMYQESHFNPYAESHAGAYGLMQLTVNTADSLGVTDIFDPRQNITAGVRHLRDLYDHFDKAYGTDRMNIALAAYNIGIGHIIDARNLARRQGLDPNRWSSLAKTLPMLRFRKYYRNTKYGYARGTQPIAYIHQIMIFYDILKRRDIQYGQVPAQYPWYGL